jgi:hypothetical protein
MSDIEGKRVLGADLTPDWEVETAEGWKRVTYVPERGWFFCGDVETGSTNVYVIARLAPKPDPIQERVEKVRAVWKEEFERDASAGWQETVDRFIERIANGETDL